jgi:hypothetical protein
MCPPAADYFIELLKKSPTPLRSRINASTTRSRFVVSFSEPLDVLDSISQKTNDNKKSKSPDESSSYLVGIFNVGEILQELFNISKKYKTIILNGCISSGKSNRALAAVHSPTGWLLADEPFSMPVLPIRASFSPQLSRFFNWPTKNTSCRSM